MFPIESNRPAQSFRIFFLESNSDKVFFAFRQINILEPDVVKFLGPRTAVEQHGNQEPLLGVATFFVKPFDFCLRQKVGGRRAITGIQPAGQSRRFGRAQPPAEKYLQQHAHIHLGAVGIGFSIEPIADFSRTQRPLKVFDVLQCKADGGFVEKFEWSAQGL